MKEVFHARRRAGRIAWRIARPLILASLVSLLMLSFFERLLVFPAPPVESADWAPSDLAHEDVEFRADDGTKLHGWYLAHPEPRAVALYSHGNGEHVAHLAGRLRQLRDDMRLSVFAWDYRGYGKSEGKPHEPNVIADARAAQLWLAKRAGVAPEEIVLIGHSLGGGVAVQLAARFPVRALVLERTFSHLVDTAAHHFPWLPVRWLMRNEFRSIEHIKQFHGPLLQVHGTHDQIVPYEQGRELFDASPSEHKRLVSVEGGTHNEPLSEQYEQALDEFLAGLAPVDVGHRPAH